jgi:hypothetical protein
VADTSRTVKVKFDGDAKGLARASKDGEREIDRFTKSVDKKYRKSGDDSGKGFAAGLRKWFSPRALGDLKKSGEFGGTLFGSGLLGAIKTPVLGPAIVATLGAVVATTLPAVGAIAGTGLVAGFGAGLAGLGLVFAAKSEDVQKKWQQTTAAMGADMQLFAKPYEATLTHAADVADRTFGRFAPSLKRSFAETAPVVSRFVDDVGDGLAELEPAVQPLSEAFQAVLTSLGPAIQSAIRSVSTGLQKLADSVKKNPDALADTVKGIGDVVNSALDLLAVLNDVNGQFKTLTGGTSLVTAVFRGLQAALMPLLFPFAELSVSLSLLNKWTKPVGDGFQYTATSAQEAATATGYWTQGLSKAQLAAMGITGATNGAGTAAENLTTKYNRQKAATDALIQSLFRLQNLALGLSGAQIGYQQALDAATASVKENGRTLDINTEKGRANRTALNGLAQSANQQTQAMIESGKGTVAAAQSAESSRSNFIRLATQMGVGSAEAKRMAQQLIAIPNVTRTAKLQANKKDLEQKLAEAKTELADPKLTASKKAKLLAEIANLQAGIAEAKRLLANVPSSKTITIKYNVAGIPRTTPSNVIGSAGRSASGGPVQPRRQYLVGERGPELLEMGGEPGRITNAERLRTGGSGEQPIIVENHIEIGGEVVRVVRTEIKANDRNTARRATAGVRAA